LEVGVSVDDVATKDVKATGHNETRCHSLGWGYRVNRGRSGEAGRPPHQNKFFLFP
jgi:hypothetical protein